MRTELAELGSGEQIDRVAVMARRPVAVEPVIHRLQCDPGQQRDRPPAMAEIAAIIELPRTCTVASRIMLTLQA